MYRFIALLIALSILSPIAMAETDYQVRAMTSSHTAGDETGAGAQLIVVYKDLLDEPCVFVWGDFRYQWVEIKQEEGLETKTTKAWLAAGLGGYSAKDSGFNPAIDLRGGISPSDWFHALSIAQWFPWDQSGYFYLSADTQIPKGFGRFGFETENTASYEDEFSTSLGIGPTWTLPFDRPIVQLSYQFRGEEGSTARALVIF